MKDVTDRLLEDGVRLFNEAFEKLLKALDRGRFAGAIDDYVLLAGAV